MNVMGIDPGSKVLALAICSTDSRDLLGYELIVLKFKSGTRAQERLGALICALRKSLADRRPDFVYVEEPIYAGSFPATLALGMVLGGIIVALTDLNIAYSLVANNVWKKELMGRGNAAKEEVEVWVRVRFPDLPEGLRQDVYDAVAIAEWGRQRFAR